MVVADSTKVKQLFFLSSVLSIPFHISCRWWSDMPPVYIPIVEWEDAWLVAMRRGCNDHEERTPRSLGSSPSWNAMRSTQQNANIYIIINYNTFDGLGDYGCRADVTFMGSTKLKVSFSK